MGGSVSCCISPGESPKIHRREVELEECPITTTEDVSEDTGTYLQHISDRELPDGAFKVWFDSLEIAQFAIITLSLIIKKTLTTELLIFESYRTGPRGQSIRPPQSQHPLPQQVTDRWSVFLS